MILSLSQLKKGDRFRTIDRINIVGVVVIDPSDLAVHVRLDRGTEHVEFVSGGRHRAFDAFGGKVVQWSGAVPVERID